MIGAIVDLGSNTFHLLIVTWPPVKSGDFTVLHRNIYFTQLSKGGGGKILPDIFKDACEALRDIKNKLDAHQPDFVRVVGTAVLRTAKNRDLFIEEAENILQYPVEILDGDMEAHYIAKGSLLHPDFQKGSVLIMDIGGGSTEFIHLFNGEVLFMMSTPLGVGVLKHDFFEHEILVHNDLTKAEDHVQFHLSALMNHLQGKMPPYLGGASGTFETLEILLFGESKYGAEITLIPGEYSAELFTKISEMTYPERLQFPNMPEKRADLIQVGIWLIQVVKEVLSCENLFVSHFAIKEGLLVDKTSPTN